MGRNDIKTIRKAGRKGKLNRKMVKEIGNLILAGNTIKDICKYLNISESSFFGWMERGRGDKEDDLSTIYVEFLESVEQNQAACVIRFVNLVSQAAKDDPRYALEYLKRHRREEWGDYKREDVQARVCVLDTNELKKLGEIESEIRRRVALLEEGSDGGTSDG